jgi:hypothetical protein
MSENGSSLENLNEVFEKSVSEQTLRSGSLDLPILRAEDSGQNFFERIRDWASSLWNTLFGEHKRISGLNSEMLLKILGFAILLVLFGFLVVSIRRLILQRRGQGPGVDLPDPETLSSVTLDEALARSLSEGRYADAAKIRWSLFLQHLNSPRSLTPSEFSNSIPNLLRVEDHQAADAIMFRVMPITTAQEFASWNQILTEREKIKAHE